MTDPSGTATRRRLCVVTHRKWVATDIAKAADYAVTHHLGFDIPEHDMLTGWWMPTEWAAHAKLSGADFSLTAPQRGWLTTLDPDFTGRKIRAFTLGQLVSDASELLDVSQPGWCKLADMKSDDIMSEWYDRVEDFVTKAKTHGVSPETVVEISDKKLELVTEYRCYVLDGHVISAAPYLHEGITWGEGIPENLDNDAAAGYAQEVVSAVGSVGEAQPTVYTLDVACDKSGRFYVVEANPVWSSAVYGNNADEAAKAIWAGSTRFVSGRYAWSPDPTLHGKYSTLRPLKFLGRKGGL